MAVALCGLNVSSQNISKDRLTKHVYVLASDSLTGRKVGSEGGRKAAEYIANELRNMGQTPIIDTFQNKVLLRNILCRFDGTDPVLKNEYIIVVCHYDHIGQNQEGQIFPGANDNATSNAALLEMVRNWKPTKRSVIFVWSDGEEFGMLGARSHVLKYISELDKIKLVIGLEMLGHLNRTNNAHLLGQELTVEGSDIVDEIKKNGELEIITQIEYSERFLGGTDTAPFWMKGIPVMVWFVNSMENYHKTTDTAQTIDYDGMVKLTKYISESITKFADTPTITATQLAKENILNRQK